MVAMKGTSCDPYGPGVPAAGAGLKHEHAGDIFNGGFAIDFFEIHAENYMGAGGPPHHLLGRVRASYPVSLHGVGLSIGSAGCLDRDHLSRLRALMERYDTFVFSEHLAWSRHEDVFLNDLLPVPYDEEALQRVVDHVDEVQTVLKTRMLLENPASYLAFETSTMTEIEFLRAVVKRSGCGLLLDVNNVYVSATNQGFSPEDYIDAFPTEHVGEIHLAGFAEGHDGEASLLIDTHATPVAEAVWSLFRRAVARAGPVPTIVERDNDVPPFAALAAEVARARQLLCAIRRQQSPPRTPD